MYFYKRTERYPVADNQSDLNSPAITNSPVQLQPSTDVEPADVHRDDEDFKVIELTRAAEDLQDSQRLQSPTIPPHRLSVDFPDLEGGWASYHDDAYGFYFEYPAAYDIGKCGKLSIESENDSYQLLFDQSTINIQITDPWTGDLLTHVRDLIAEDQMTSSIDPGEIQELWIDGVRAFIYYRIYSKPSATSYEKVVFTSNNDLLFRLRVAEINFNASCSVRPISEEAIFNHVLATWEYPQ